MKKALLLFGLFLFAQQVFAKHIIGGEMFYTYLGKGTAPNTSKYKITLRLFRDDYAPADAAEMPADVFIGIFSRDNNAQYPAPGGYYAVRRSSYESVHVNDFPQCMVNKPRLAYHSASFSFDVELPDNSKGYTASYQTCCRITPIDNISGGRSGAGSTFMCDIPPVADNSPVFDATIDAVCGGKQFDLTFKATDADGDSLSYSFEGAYDGGNATDASNINPAPPPYPLVNYLNTYSASKPLGDKATIDPLTGKITGIAPPIGRYVVTVAVTSWRNIGGVMTKLSTHRKDFIINVSNCDFASAQLFPRGAYCDDFLTSFENNDFSPHNQTFYWEFYDSNDNLIKSTTEEMPQVQFPDAGVYKYKLVVNKDDRLCSDSAEATIGIYPGFFPDFEFNGKCINSEVFFTDKSTANYGTINSWNWDFGVRNNLSSKSTDQHPKFTYTTPGTYNTSLIVQSDVGCIDTLTVPITIVEKPPFDVSSDTLICNIDDLVLSASGSGTGTVTWTPNYQIDDVTSFNPTVSPKQTTTYYANYEESRGCNNIDSVIVNVVTKVSLSMPADTTICLTDSIILSPLTDGLNYQWGPASTILNSNDKDVVVYPDRSTTYNLTSSIGGCSTSGSVSVFTVPYPNAQSIPDTTICFGSQLQLTASGGSVYEWQPAVFLNDNNIANPISSPTRSIQYILKVNDLHGCPKPDFDTITVNVVTPIVDAGPRDTAIVVGEPLQLNAEGNGQFYIWTPDTGLDDPTIPDPVAILNRDQEYIVRTITEGDCIAEDTILVKVFNLKPGFYVPNAFTPNNDGLNDDIKPIAIGLKSLKYFRIYNRLGQIVFSTNNFKEGWDGSFKGSPQTSGVFAWTAEAIDYTGKKIQAKGSITLIR